MIQLYQDYLRPYGQVLPVTLPIRVLPRVPAFFRYPIFYIPARLVDAIKDVGSITKGISHGGRIPW